jgi:hypothetical protein
MGSVPSVQQMVHHVLARCWTTPVLWPHTAQLFRRSCFRARGLPARDTSLHARRLLRSLDGDPLRTCTAGRRGRCNGA